MMIITHHKTKLFALLLALFVAIVFLQPRTVFAAAAETADLTLPEVGTYTCNPPPGQLVEAIVRCVEAPVRAAVLKAFDATNPSRSGLLAKTSYYMFQIVKVMLILAIVLFGIRILNFRNNPFAVGVGLLIRIAIVMLLVYNNGAYNFGGYATNFFNMFDEIVNLGNQGGVSPWRQIDAFLSDLIGFVTNEPSEINRGIIALLNGSFFAKNFGILLTVVGVFAIITLIKFILQAVYLYLASIIAFGLLIAIVPIFIPFFIFGYTERYLTKWFDLIISTILTPLLMFSFLGIFLDVPPVGLGPPSPGILRTTVERIFIALGNGNYDDGKNYIERCLRSNQPVGSYLLATDANMSERLVCPPPLLPDCPERDKVKSSVQIFMNPFVYRSFNYSPLNVPMIDCGINDSNIKRDVFLELLNLLIYAYIIKEMLKKIPDISSDLASGMSTGVSSLTPQIKRFFSMLKK